MRPKLILLIIALSLASSETYAKRGEPKEAQPVSLNGVKYSAPQCWLQVKESLGPGYIQANDLKTGKLLWQLRVYEIRINENIERDVQDVFITSLKIVDGKLHVWNEAHDHFVVDLAQRRVIEGAKRVYYYR
jgi:hypothetical protein